MRRGILFLALLLAARAEATVPSTFSVQGVLRDSTGMLQTMAVNVSVQLFDAQTSGNSLAGPYQVMNVPVSNGLFTLVLNDASLNTELSSASEVWLAVITCPASSSACTGTVVGAESFPLQRVTPELYALMCSQADNATQLGGKPASMYLTSASTVAASQVSGTVASATTASSFSGSLSGDVTGTQGATKVSTLSGGAVFSSGAPTSGQVLKFSAGVWAPGTDNNSGGTVTSVAAGNGLTGGTITGTGTIALSTPVSVANGGLGNSTGNGSALTNLNGANLTAGSVDGTALVSSGAHTHGLTVNQGAQVNGGIGTNTFTQICADCGSSGGAVIGGECLATSVAGLTLYQSNSTMPSNPLSNWCCTWWNTGAALASPALSVRAICLSVNSGTLP